MEFHPNLRTEIINSFGCDIPVFKSSVQYHESETILKSNELEANSTLGMTHSHFSFKLLSISTNN